MNLVVKVLSKCGISFRWCTQSEFCTQISRPPSGVHIASKAITTAAGLERGTVGKGWGVGQELINSTPERHHFGDILVP